MSLSIEVITEKYAAIKQAVKPFLSNRTDVRFLCYHSVVAGSKLPDITHTPTITEEKFKEQLETIKNSNFDIVSMDKALQILSKGEVTNKSHICITFDDGYLDNWEIAWPILRYYGYPAHFFITTNWIGGKKLVERRGKNIEAACMGKDHIRKILEQGGSIGSHSMSHRELSKENSDRIIAELKESRKVLEELSGKSVTTFSYPFSNYNSRVLDLLQKTGYDYAFTIDIRPLKRITGKERFKISRVVVKDNDNAQNVRIKLSGGYDWAYYYTKTRRRASILFGK